MVNAKLNWQITEELASWLGARYRGKTPRFTQNYSSLSAVQKKVYDEKGEYLKALDGGGCRSVVEDDGCPDAECCGE